MSTDSADNTLDPAQVLFELNSYAAELDRLSKDLVGVEERLLTATVEYEEYMGSFEQGLWEQHLAGDKFPPQELRQRLGHRGMSPELLGRYTALTGQRRRLEKRISAVKSAIEAKRSVVSALKEEGLAVGTTGGR